MLRYIIIGYGNIGLKRRALLGKKCVATVDPFVEAADYDDFAEVPRADYDAAILAVPNGQKLPLMRSLLSAGKHVLVEKPVLFSDEAEAKDIENAARGRNVVWYTSYNHRYEPNILRLRERVAAGALGELYHGRLFYGNGTVQNSIGNWRESRLGVLDDLGCHLIDLVGYVFGNVESDYRLFDARPLESRVYDHCLFATGDRRLVLECGTTVWKNSFSIDAFGSLGSLHVKGLCKWGPSMFIERRRAFPSGVPDEVRATVEMSDPTWAADLDEFERCTTQNQTAIENDLRVSKALNRLAQQAERLLA